MRRLLIVVDYQNDFVSGTLGFTKALELEQKIADKIIEYRRDYNEIVFTFDTHTMDYLQTQEGRSLPVAHCIKDSDGWQLYGMIDTLRGAEDICFHKRAFGSAELFDWLRVREYESIELVGVVSNICVISNTILAKTALPEAQVIVDAACVASNDDFLNEAALNVMASLQVRVINRKTL